MQMPAFRLYDGDNKGNAQSNSRETLQHLYVLPVLLLEFLALSFTRAVLPSILIQEYGKRVYLVLGCADAIRGLLAFFACPLFGKLSDIIGRRICLLVTVIGSCAPVCSLALFSWDDPVKMENDADAASMEMLLPVGGEGEPVSIYHSIPPNAINIFVVLLSLSGIFSSTFTLVFAYISDFVTNRDERVSAYGLALATFGLSYTIGPMAGGYLGQENKHFVFLCSLGFTILDVLYIYFILPESRPNVSSATSLLSADHNISWNPWDTVRLIAVDPFLRKVGEVAFLYYTGLWAVISTLSIYAVQKFHLGPERLGELMSALGLSTMIAEAIIVRILVPLIGEKNSVRVGLVSFALQCFVLGIAYEGWHLFICVAFSMLGNLVYPSLSSLVSGSVEPSMVGEALGAINGVKALTEGIGPLVFGGLMTLSEDSALPGWPYLIASTLVVAAYHVSGSLPDTQDTEDYVHELEYKRNRRDRGLFEKAFGTEQNLDDDEEYKSLLSEVEESSSNCDDDVGGGVSEVQMLPLTFGSLLNKQEPPETIIAAP